MVKTRSDFVTIYGEKIISIIETCDGSRNLATIAEDLKIPLGTLMFIAEQLILAGLLEIQH